MIRNFFKPYHPQIYLAGLVLAVIGMPLSKVLMSISMFTLFINWLVEGGIKEKLNLFIKNKMAVALASLFLLHLIGLLWTSDFNYALKDIKNKIPLLLLPLVLSGTPALSEKNFRLVLHFFLFALFCETAVGIYTLYGLHGSVIANMREMTRHVSHIRFSLMLCLGIFSVPYLIHKWKDEYSMSQKVLLGSLAAWLVFFLLILQAANGLIVFFITGLFSLFYLTLKSKNTKLKIALFSVMVIAALSGILWTCNLVKKFYYVEEINLSELDSLTALGNPYTHKLNDKRLENGNRLGIYVAWEEMKEAWNARSSKKFTEKDENGNMIGFTLERFLTSKNYRKDAEGVAKLTDVEVLAIQNGIANYKYLDHLSFSDRIYEILWELEDYRLNGNPSGHSVMQRFEYWRAAWNIFKDHQWIGVGTGDLAAAYKEQYEKMNSPLEEKFRKRAHNQYLTIAVTFGIFGLVWFMVSLLFPVLALQFKPGYLYWVFLLISLLSFISEDTLEPQAGVTFFAFFNSFLLFCSGRKSE